MKTKNEIVDRLYKAGHITLEEVLVLMEKEYYYVNIPYEQPYNPYPVNPPYVITSDYTDTTELDRLKTNINFTSK